MPSLRRFFMVRPTRTELFLIVVLVAALVLLIGGMLGFAHVWRQAHIAGDEHLRRQLAEASAAEIDTKAHSQTPADLLKKSKRVVFLGDSITASGGYVVDFEVWLLAQPDGPRPTVINAGLSSETVSGLSEEGHAAGKFPRPDLAERLDRVLAKTKPDLVIACYGINCGIYQPFDAERFQKYQQGIERLKQTVEKSGAKLVIMTPPVYDDSRAKNAFSYNEVLDRYSAWLIEQRKTGWLVIDLHEPMTQALAKRKKADSQFTFEPDAVHPNSAGHWFIAQQLCKGFGDTGLTNADTPAAMLKAQGLPESLLTLIEKRAALRRDAYVSAAGHKRPGVAAGLPIEEAEEQADVLTKAIDATIEGEASRD